MKSEICHFGKRGIKKSVRGAWNMLLLQIKLKVPAIPVADTHFHFPCTNWNCNGAVQLIEVITVQFPYRPTLITHSIRAATTKLILHVINFHAHTRIFFFNAFLCAFKVKQKHFFFFLWKNIKCFKACIMCHHINGCGDDDEKTKKKWKSTHTHTQCK